ncbi:hypothetical protein DE146DRAFT_646311 [Phaeosphaeria sp. MPI-PUGE-AT-0046c]|nr:hypothetical protein DE146DRAFT_646311 [Phaeosphaeria sp. MPI-PUGE-AT-0046c]
MRVQQEHWQLVVGKINACIDRKLERPDFISTSKRDNDRVRGVTLPEPHATGSLLIIAGIETTVKVLNGGMNYLIKNPEQLASLTKEVRSAFDDKNDSNVQTVSEA